MIETDTELKERLLNIEERLKKLEKENDILKIELANSIIEKIKLDEAKSRFLDDHFKNSSRYDEMMDEEYKRREDVIKEMKKEWMSWKKKTNLLFLKKKVRFLKQLDKYNIS